MALLIGQLREMTENWTKERGDDMQQRAIGRTRTLGCCSEDGASVHGTPALPTVHHQADLKISE